jgi:uncharacterized repeat protein (TIGR03803 family)
MSGVTVALVVLGFAMSPVAACAETKILYSFAGDTDGEYLDTDLVMDAAGNIYGTSVQGGDFGSGTVWVLSPSPSGWHHTVLYSFKGADDGGEPYKGVTLDSQGNLYGTTVTGGSGQGCEGGCGVVYKLTKSGDTWTQSVIYAFNGGDDGSGPGSGVTIDANGNVYGMTPTGGAYGVGVIYELQPGSFDSWNFSVIHPFTGGDDGSGGSAGRMIFDKSGNLYGVTTTGGANGNGVVFELKPANNGAWNLQPLYPFKGMPDAGFPYGGLVFDRAGNLYGTTYYGGENGLGAVYELVFQQGAWSEKVLYSFAGGTDGSASISNLVFDRAGDLLGTTSQGGAGCDCGVIFKLAPDGHGGWTESVVYRFKGAPDGAFAYNGMTGDGWNFYGTTVHGGLSDDGTVYKFNPAEHWNGGGTARLRP